MSRIPADPVLDSPPLGAVPVEVEPEHPVVARLAVDGTLGARVRRGLSVTAVAQALLLVAQLGSQVLVMRLLLPEDYGLVALSAVLVSFATLLTDLGLTSAVVQARRITERMLSTAFWFSLLVGAATSALVIASAPLVARFYDDPRITPLVQLAGLGFVLNVAAVPFALLQRSMRFRQLSTTEVVAALSGIATTVGLAVAGAGAHALVAGPLVQIVVLDVLLWSTVRWRPHHFVSRDELRALWRFGRGVTGANVMYYVGISIDTVLIGQALTKADVGLYNRAYNIMNIPGDQVTRVISRVLLPALSELQDDLPRLRAAWLDAVRLSLLLGVPVGIGVAVSAPALVEVLYGTTWLPLVPVLSLLATSVPLLLVGRNIGPVFQALGRTGQEFRLATVMASRGAVVLLWDSHDVVDPGWLEAVATALERATTAGGASSAAASTRSSSAPGAGTRPTGASASSWGSSPARSGPAPVSAAASPTSWAPSRRRWCTTACARTPRR